MVFFDAYEGEQQRLLLALHRLLTGLPDARMKLRYPIPLHYRRSWICYLNPLKAGGVGLAFTRGNELEDSGGLLEARGRAQVRGIVLQEARSLDLDARQPLLCEARPSTRQCPTPPSGRRGAALLNERGGRREGIAQRLAPAFSGKDLD